MEKNRKSLNIPLDVFFGMYSFYKKINVYLIYKGRVVEASFLA